MLPPPPVLKTTIIHLGKELDGDDNYEILTNEYKGTSQESSRDQPILPKKKKRRSCANIDSQELAKRKHETKQLHSMIEKRRRIKINREFEALKYLIPACKTTTTIIKSNNNGNKIDGMYKLTILKSSVEYILYLHHLILEQSNIINQYDPGYHFDDSFAKIELDVNQYRNIDKEFDFKNININQNQHHNQNLTNKISHKNKSQAKLEQEEEEEEEPEEEEDEEEAEADEEVVEEEEVVVEEDQEDIDDDDRKIQQVQLQFQNQVNDGNKKPFNQFHEKEIEVQRLFANSQPMNVQFGAQRASNASDIQLPSPEITPDILPRKHSIAISPHSILPTSRFRLPDPAINYPKKKYFKSRVPDGNIIVEDTSLDHDASRALLQLRKSSIDSLLN